MATSIGSNASNTLLSFVDEATWGTIPATPELSYVRTTGNGLKGTYNKTQSEEITAKAGVSDIITTSGGTEGDVNFEPSYGPWFDSVLEQAARDTFDSFGVMTGGVEEKSVAFERQFLSEGATIYDRFTGQVLGTLTIPLDKDASGPIAATAAFMGKEMELAGSTAITGVTYSDANTNPIIDIANWRNLTFEIEGVSKTACIKSLNIGVNLNTESQQGQCTAVTTYPDLAAKGIGYGQQEITLEVSAYFNSQDYLEMYQQNTAGAIGFILSDGVRGYKMTFPRVKVMDASAPVEGNNTTVVQSITFVATIDSAQDSNWITEKIGNLESGAAIKLEGDPISPADAVGTYYYDGDTQSNGENVLFSLNGEYAIWYDGTDTLLTPADEVGAAVTTYFNVLSSYDPEGTWVAVTGTGTLTGTAYDPTA